MSDKITKAIYSPRMRDQRDCRECSDSIRIGYRCQYCLVTLIEELNFKLLAEVEAREKAESEVSRQHEIISRLHDEKAAQSMDFVKVVKALDDSKAQLSELGNEYGIVCHFKQVAEEAEAALAAERERAAGLIEALRIIGKDIIGADEMANEAIAAYEAIY